MLVLTRKVGEGIAIGEDIKIVVMQIKGKQVRLGIKASPETVVHREEIFQKIQEENVLASTVEVGSLDKIKIDPVEKPEQRSFLFKNRKKTDN